VADAAAEWDDMVLVGVIARTHGIKGEVILNSHTDFPELRFRAGARLYNRQGAGPVTTLEIASVRIQQGRPIVGLVGFASIGDAERLAGSELRVPESEQHLLPDGTYYHHQLIGCEVVTEAGESVGRVTAVEGDGAATRLVVRGPRAEVLIPLADEICRIDIAARQIVITPPEGLLDVNGEWR
jgi:16S rRNA processing protein RimM